MRSNSKTQKKRSHFSEHYPSGRHHVLEQQSIGLVSKNLGFGPQASHSAAARIEIVQIVRNPSPPFHEHAYMIHPQRRAIPAVDLLYRRGVGRPSFVPLPEPRAPDLGVPPGEGGGEIGEGFLMAGAQGVGGGGGGGDGRRGGDRRGEGGKFEEAGEEEEEEGGGGEHWSEVVDGL